MRMPRSTALHMSYTVSAATAAAVSASISTPVRPVTAHRRLDLEPRALDVQIEAISTPT